MDHSTFLFPRPTALRGAARLLDLGGTLSGVFGSPTPQEADALAMWHDWAAVGDDLRSAIAGYGHDAELAGR